jgi:hypothetical protein
MAKPIGLAISPFSLAGPKPSQNVFAKVSTKPTSHANAN